MTKLLAEETTDFSLGMDDGSAATSFPSTAVRLIQNGRIEPDGTVSRRFGGRRKHEEALGSGPGYGAIWFRTEDGEDQIIAFSGNKAYMSSGIVNDSWDEIATGLPANYWSFAKMRVGSDVFLFAANGGQYIYRWDGTTWDTLPNAPENVKYIAVHNGRLYAAGHMGVIVQGSRIAAPDEWASPWGVTVQAITHDGGEITGLYQVGPHLLVFDEFSTSYIDGFGEATLVVESGATGFSRSVGCIGFRTIVGVGDNGVAWLSSRGVEYYTAGAGIRLISRRVQRFVESVDRTALQEDPGRVTAAYDPVRQEIHVALSTTGTRNDRVLVINILQDPLLSRGGLRAAATVDRFETTTADILFAEGPQGYLTDGGSLPMRVGHQGYATLETGGGSGDTISVDGQGYLGIDANDALPATLFMAPNSETGQSPVLHSLGYDGFVRKHWGGYVDDEDMDGEGGLPVQMTIVTRPFLFGRVRYRKKTRVVRVAAICDQSATVGVRVRSGGTVTSESSIVIAGTDYEQPKRNRAMVSAVGDQPQVELVTSSANEGPLRIALIGVAAEILEEPVS